LGGTRSGDRLRRRLQDPTDLVGDGRRTGSKIAPPTVYPHALDLGGVFDAK
jgi:hypothetical protein